MLNDYKQQYGIKEKELYRLIEEKKKLDGQLTLEGLQNALKSYIDVKYAKPKQQFNYQLLKYFLNIFNLLVFNYKIIYKNY